MAVLLILPTHHLLTYNFQKKRSTKYFRGITQIGGIAGRVIPVIGAMIGKTTGKYIGTTLGGLAGEIAGDKLAEVIVPAVLDAAESGYIRVDVREDHRPPKFFERMMER